MVERSARAVFLDRDGVLNHVMVRGGKPFPPAAVDDVRLVAGAGEACRRLRGLGYLLIMVTNQPDIARGAARRETVDAINARVGGTLGLDGIYMCAHDDADGCDCRKPKPGLLLRAARTFDIDLGASIMVGDRWKDVDAGRNAGCRTVFIDLGHDEPRPADADFVCGDLAQAAAWIEAARTKPRDRA